MKKVLSLLFILAVLSSLIILNGCTTTEDKMSATAQQNDKNNVDSEDVQKQTPSNKISPPPNLPE